MLMHTLPGVLEVSVQQYVSRVLIKQLLLKDVASTHIGSIVVSLIVFSLKSV